jgi:hypothetical protein
MTKIDDRHHVTGRGPQDGSQGDGPEDGTFNLTAGGAALGMTFDISAQIQAPSGNETTPDG